MDPAKVAVILNMPPPTSIKQWRSTLGCMGYYHRFIRNYALITTPLEKLLKKTEPFIWVVECDVAFDTLKEKLASALILVYPE